jgi:hypothetical protein
MVTNTTSVGIWRSSYDSTVRRSNSPLQPANAAKPALTAQRPKTLGMPSQPSNTDQMLALRRLGVAVDERFVEWAIDMLTQGHDSPGLRILAGETVPFCPSEMESLVDRTLRELELAVPPTVEDALVVIARGIAQRVIDGEVARDQALLQLRDYCVKFDMSSALFDFYSLYYAMDDLRTEGGTWYWPDADPGNIDRIIDERFRALIKDGR